ncbi:MAG: transferrin-binding protein-like solute binding protein [Deltaproteobacteria bacterium]|nr:transferrin-binding protein-like solute binding protein [Deltaproteobacteria bacterium]
MLKRNFAIALAVAMVMTALYGCSSGVSKSTHNDVQAELDAANAMIAQLQTNVQNLQTQLTDAQGEVTRLEGELQTATDNADSIQMMLDTANGEVTRLEGALQTATDNADSLQTMLNAARGDVTRLTGELNTANGNVTRLEGELGTANGNVTRLEGELGTANGNVTRLEGELETARTTMGSPDDAADDSADASLHAQLNAAKARIAELEAGTAPDVLDPIKMAASGAASDADDAYMAADRAAGEAEDADDNRATLQTGDANSVADAEAARGAANTAMAEAKKAQDAADAANAAGNADDATAEKVKADAARDAAMMAQTEAEGHRDNAVADSMVELKIDGTVKSVGDTSIDATAARSVVTADEGNDAQTKDTGLQAKDDFPMTMGAQTVGRATVAGDPDATPNPFRSPVANAAARRFPIGKTVDSDDDTARLMIVTQYAGTNTVKVYAIADADTNDLSTTTGRIQIAGADTATDATDDRFSALRSRGMYYPAGADGELTTADSADSNTDGVIDETELQGDTVAADAKAREVFSYVSAAGTDALFGTNDDVMSYVVLQETTTDPLSGTTTYTYRPVDIHVDTDPDGDAATAVVPSEVTAVIPEAADYSHIHFGVWASLGAAAKSGAQDIADLGIGFVQSIGDGMTGDDMPNNGSGTYAGNWVATVQAADTEGDGAITLTSGAASLAADFGDGEITATLTGLATLEGDISGNTFSGDAASSITHATLSSTAKFTGTMSGGFYGSKAAEAGGVFDFATEDNEGGAFRGAFGADRTDD